MATNVKFHLQYASELHENPETHTVATKGEMTWCHTDTITIVIYWINKRTWRYAYYNTWYAMFWLGSPMVVASWSQGGKNWYLGSVLDLRICIPNTNTVCCIDQLTYKIKICRQMQRRPYKQKPYAIKQYAADFIRDKKGKITVTHIYTCLL